MVSDINARYQKAEALMQGMYSNRVVLNDAVYAHWIDDSNFFWYQRATRIGKEYRLVDASTSSNRPAFDHQQLADALAELSNQAVDPNNLPINIVNIRVFPLEIHFMAFDKPLLFTANKLVDEADIEPVEGLLSPDGKKTAFVRDYNLWVKCLASGEEYALTKDGSADFSYATSKIGGSSVEAVWSPDSQFLFTHQLDQRQVQSTPFVQHIPSDGSVRPKLIEQKISYPGDVTVETYRLLIIDILSGYVHTPDYKPLSLCRVGFGFFSQEKLGWWAKDGRCAFFVDMSRGAQSARVVEFDRKSGATRIVLGESSSTFIKLSHSLLESPLLLPLTDSDELIWFSETDGWGHLYLYDLGNGQLKNKITEGAWLVRDILHFDTQRRELLIQTAGRDLNISPYYQDICRVNIDTQDLMPLVSGDFDCQIYRPDSLQVFTQLAFGLDSTGISGVSPDGRYLVTTQSRVDKEPISLLFDRNGKELLTLERSDPFGLPLGWQWPERIKLRSADCSTDLYGVVFRPPDFSTKKCYPVLDYCCAHPGTSLVPHGAFVNAPAGYSYLDAAAYAALGFIVVAIEVPGSPYRDKVFQDASYGQISSANSFDDRIAALHQLAELYSYMDLTRVGIVGCDGITGPVYGLLERPEFYKVGVVISFEDSRFDAAAITEMFEGCLNYSNHMIAENLADSLQGKLLLIHGMMDMVTPATGTYRLIQALRAANKDYDLLLLPNGGHSISSYALRRSWDYLVTHLQNIEPPNKFKLTTGFDLLLA